MIPFPILAEGFEAINLGFIAEIDEEEREAYESDIETGLIPELKEFDEEEEGI